MKATIEQRRTKITQGILRAFEEKFGTDEKPIEFETIWPISKWETLHTDTRTFLVELHLTSGKVKDITEEF